MISIVHSGSDIVVHVANTRLVQLFEKTDTWVSMRPVSTWKTLPMGTFNGLQDLRFLLSYADVWSLLILLASDFHLLNTATDCQEGYKNYGQIHAICRNLSTTMLTNDRCPYKSALWARFGYDTSIQHRLHSMLKQFASLERLFTVIPNSFKNE